MNSKYDAILGRTAAEMNKLRAVMRGMEKRIGLMEMMENKRVEALDKKI